MGDMMLADGLMTNPYTITSKSIAFAICLDSHTHISYPCITNIQKVGRTLRFQHTMAHIQYVDSLIREYMLFRGFAGSLKAFDGELKTDKDKGFRVDKIIEHITHAINVHDLAAVRDMWSHLDGHLFSKLEHSFTSGS